MEFYKAHILFECYPMFEILSYQSIHMFRIAGKEDNYTPARIQGGSNMTGTDLYVNKPHCAAAVRP